MSICNFRTTPATIPESDIINNNDDNRDINNNNVNYGPYCSSSSLSSSQQPNQQQSSSKVDKITVPIRAAEVNRFQLDQKWQLQPQPQPQPPPLPPKPPTKSIYANQEMYHDIVRELLCLIQGESGKYLQFNSSRMSQFRLTSSPSNRKRIDSNVTVLLRRAAIVGELYRIIESQCANNTNSSDYEDCGRSSLIRQSFGKALRAELVDYHRLVTDLYGATRDAHHSIKLIELYTILDRTLIKFKALYNLIKLADRKAGIELLNQIYDCSLNGNPLVQELMRTIFQITSEPFFNYILQWLFSTANVQQFRFRKENTANNCVQRQSDNQMNDFLQFIDNIDSGSNERDECQTHNDSNQNKTVPTFLTTELLNLIYRFGDTMQISRKLFAKDFDNKEFSDKTNNFIRKLCSTELCKNQSSKYSFNSMFAIELTRLHQLINDRILEELRNSDHGTREIELVERFLFRTCGDVMARIVEKLERKGYNIFKLFSGNRLNLKEIRLLQDVIQDQGFLYAYGEDLLFPMYFDPDSENGTGLWKAVLLCSDGDDQHDDDNKGTYQSLAQTLYQKIFSHFYQLKLQSKLLHDCWKELNYFHSYISQRWEYKTNSIVARLTIALNRLLLVVLGVQGTMFEILQHEWFQFKRKTLDSSEIFKIKLVHKQFITKLLSRIEYQLNTKSIEDQKIYEFCNKISHFIRTTRNAFQSEIGQWHEFKLENRQNYMQHVDELIQFVDSI